MWQAIFIVLSVFPKGMLEERSPTTRHCLPLMVFNTVAVIHLLGLGFGRLGGFRLVKITGE